jgi:hypothetical protein
MKANILQEMYNFVQSRLRFQIGYPEGCGKSNPSADDVSFSLSAISYGGVPCRILEFNTDTFSITFTPEVIIDNIGNGPGNRKTINF